MKKKEFNVPFIGYDYGKDNGWNYDALIGECGNPVFGIKIKNLVQQYSADPDEYLRFQGVLQQVVSTLGEGRLIQKLDIFGKKKYHAEPAKEYLQQKYSKHFEGRIYKTMETLLIFTDIIENKRKKPSINSMKENTRISATKWTKSL